MNEYQFSTAGRAVIAVGNGGRGFVIETRDGERIVLTAAPMRARREAGRGKN